MTNKKEWNLMLKTLGDGCPECKKGKIEVVEGFINLGHFFLRCKECGYEYDN